MPFTVRLTRQSGDAALGAGGKITAVEAPTWLALIPVLSTLLAAIGTAAAPWVNWQASLSLEREKLRSSLVLKASSAGDPGQVAETLRYWGELVRLKDRPQ